MASMSGSMTWDLIANSTRYVAGMNKARAATDQMTREQKKAIRQHELMGKAAGVVGVAVAVAFGKKIVNAASDMNESVSKSSVVFGKNAAAVRKWADNAAKSMGMSTQAALEASGTLGNLMLSMGNTEDAAADMSMTMVQLAADLASFNNVDASEVLMAMRSALTGEIAPMRRFGVNLTDVTLKAKAMELGLYDGVGAMDVQAKSAAAYKLILEQTTTAQGDYARTADGLANSTRTLNAQWQDTQAKLGEGLLPAAQGTVGAMNNLLGVFNAAPPALRNVTLGVAAAGVAFVALAPRIQATKAALADMPVAAGRASKGFKALGKAMAAIAAVSVAAQALGNSSVNSGLSDLEGTLRGIAETGDGMDKLGYSIEYLTGGTYDFADALARSQAPDWWDKVDAGLAGIVGASSNLDLATQSVANLDAALASMVKNGLGGDAFRAVERMREELRAQGVDVNLLSDKALPNYRDALNEATKYSGGMGDAAGDAADEVKTLAEEMEGLNSPTRDAAKAQMELIESAADLAKGLRENGRSFDMSTEKGRENLTNLMDVTAGIEEMGAAMEAQGTPRAKVIEAMKRERDALVKNLEKMGLAPKKAQALVDKYLKIPPAVDPATDSVNKLNDAINRLPSTKTVTIKVSGATRRVIDPSTLAGGGLVTGPGTGTSDDVPAWLSNGEYVLRASTVQRIGVANLDRLNAGTGMASGGLVNTGFAQGSSGTSSKKPKRRKSTGSSSASRATAYTWDVGLRDSIRGANSPLDAFDMSAYAEATSRAAQAADDLAAAQKAQADARRALNQAGTPEERARAQEQMAQAVADEAAAQRELTSAKKAQASSKLTSANVLSRFRDRARKLDKFRRDLDTLRKRGLAPAILREILDAGIDEGGAMAAALVAGNDIVKINKTWGWITADATAMAKAYGERQQVSGGGGSTGTTGSTGSGSGISVTLANANRPIVLKMDSEAVWRGLVKLKKAKGGVSLGLS